MKISTLQPKRIIIVTVSELMFAVTMRRFLWALRPPGNESVRT
ncbi:MAG: hypothetical protein O6765_08670 [Gammaproteobacteria bacterium]|nr:hypothetical protein [Gammaproteobacteria bacterium]MCZ6585221.1 hypothetical protein [Gammaproteobacteria bacterium]